MFYAFQFHLQDDFFAENEVGLQEGNVFLAFCCELQNPQWLNLHNVGCFWKEKSG